MMDDLTIRETGPEEAAQVLALYPLAFPEEDLTPVVSALLRESEGVMSLAGFHGDTLVGHVLFTLCDTGQDGHRGALLGPLGVKPEFQRQGLGGALIRAGFGRLGQTGVAQVFVLGDPAYYGRFGFRPERQVLTPCPIPVEWADAWQSLLLEDAAALEAGPLSLPQPWMDPILWAP